MKPWVFKTIWNLWFCTFPSVVFIITLSNKFHLHIFHFLVINNMGNQGFFVGVLLLFGFLFFYKCWTVLLCLQLFIFCFSSISTYFAGMRWKDQLNARPNCTPTYLLQHLAKHRVNLPQPWLTSSLVQPGRNFTSKFPSPMEICHWLHWE